MLGNTARQGGGNAPAKVLAIPDELRQRLTPWVDVREVGADGFWAWLATIVPLLPAPSPPGQSPEAPERLPEDRVRQLARDLVDCARARARLTVIADHYYTDNVALARRLKALEASLRSFATVGRSAETVPDPEAEEAAGRYLPGGSR
ncbi:MAG TPA: hypothetical protein VMG14_05820 [Thermoplasmata archaeon]|nr:hypothetical protein [Thermoplasmata archaeon]